MPIFKHRRMLIKKDAKTLAVKTKRTFQFSYLKAEFEILIGQAGKLGLNLGAFRCRSDQVRCSIRFTHRPKDDSFLANRVAHLLDSLDETFLFEFVQARPDVAKKT